MRKIYALLLAAIMTFSFALTCAAAEGDAQPTQNTSASRTLIVYFSHTGNTKTVAEYIQGQTGGDLVELLPVNAYPTDYDSTVEVARRELNQQARPRLQTTIENMGDYDTVYVGYPIWWSTIPMPVATFLESYSFEGKTVISFCTHAGSGLGSSVSDIQNLVPGATVLNGLAVAGSNAASSQNDVAAWVQGMSSTGTAITLTAGDTVITAALNNTQTARDIANALPLSVNTRNWDSKAYYGRVRGEVTAEGEQHNSLRAGDVVYWIEGNALILYYDAERNTNISAPVITVGKITSDLSVFENLDESVPFEVQVRG